MRTHKLMLQALGVLSALWIAPANAQSTDNLRADIPFAFSIGKQKMPAGQYRITAAPGSGIMTLQNVAKKIGAFTITYADSQPQGEQADCALVIFNTYGSQHYLSGVWNPVSGSTRRLFKSSAEREAASAGEPVKLAMIIAAPE